MKHVPCAGSSAYVVLFNVYNNLEKRVVLSFSG